MKQLLVLIVFLILSPSLKSQDYLPFADSNSIWMNQYQVYEFQDPDNPIPTVVYENTLKFCSPGLDTIINSITYSQIYYCNGNYKGALRDEEGQVFYVPNDSISEFLLYDFSVIAGDTVFDVYYEYYPYTSYQGNNSNAVLWPYFVVNYTDSVLIDGYYRKRVDLSAGGARWIEGIGCEQGLFSETYLNVSMYSLNLQCMSINETSYYPSFQSGACVLNVGIDDINKESPVVNIYPNPSNAKFNIEIKNNSKLESLFLLNNVGQRFNISYMLKENSVEVNMESFPEGLYFLLLEIGGKVYTKKLIKISDLD